MFQFSEHWPVFHLFIGTAIYLYSGPLKHFAGSVSGPGTPVEYIGSYYASIFFPQHKLLIKTMSHLQDF